MGVLMTGLSRFSANSSLRAAKEALDGPAERDAGAIPERALPRSGTFSRPLAHHRLAHLGLARHGDTSAWWSHVGLGAWDASVERICLFGDQAGATRQGNHSTVQTVRRLIPHRYSVIAFCLVRVLNSPRALTAFRTDKLTRNERAARYGRNDAKTR